MLANRIIRDETTREQISHVGFAAFEIHQNLSITLAVESPSDIVLRTFCRIILFQHRNNHMAPSFRK